jgi:hypothetical protein
MDRAAIFSTVLACQAVRRAQGLPLLDVRAEYDRAANQAQWSAFVEQHHAEAVQRVLAEQTARDPGFGQKSWGGRMAVQLLAQRELQTAFRNWRG